MRADLCVIGAGSGGLSVAAGAAQMGARVVLVEAGEMGGDCLNAGCVPSKALIAAASRAEAVRSGGLGTRGAAPETDFAAVMAHVRATVAAIAPHDSQERFEGLGVTVIRAHARFIGRDRIEAGGQEVTARRFVVATGARPVLPDIPGLADTPHLTNETLWSLDTLPGHLAVLGGGPLGLEMAQAFRRLGARVTVLEAGQALSREEPELASFVLSRLRAEGVEIRENTPVRAVRQANGEIAVETENATITADRLLIAAGRRPATAGLGLERAGVETGPDGAVRVDARLRSTNRRIFAVGDVAGLGQFTHLAGYHAGLVVRAALLGLPARLRHDHVPRVTYTDPELAQVGLTEAQARAKWPTGIETILTPLAGNDRARTEGLTGGALKLVLRKGRPVGVGICAPGAGEMIGLWSLALATRRKLTALPSTILPYPTLSEVSKSAAGAYFSPRVFDNAWLRRWVRVIQSLP
ncbi:dihydrolipoyl dehydrogenase family protein [Acidimangrovimonas sediminis]|uniref:dihydrolipoyl dehydrogenase family protein n=1 Tax=Acidimangrovimonas sediminis TaxID=2056283 RepID=UPI000C7F9750|nr:FAD-dependent oxidoreductase [Acidimangrovimonas sediminis]